ncbi:MAG TPA: hypothetical protein VEZ50_01135 [Nodosilinea sp.]|jgi:hypothetical protein|nr:hypothetical protein [Nodosilinea sp.]
MHLNRYGGHQVERQQQRQFVLRGNRVGEWNSTDASNQQTSGNAQGQPA